MEKLKEIAMARRKMLAFFSVLLGVCIPAAWKHGINWPLVVLTGGIFLVLIGAISVEKILLAWIEKVKGKV